MAARQVTSRGLVLAALTVIAGVVLVAMWPRGMADIGRSSRERPRTQGPAQADPAVPPALGLEDMEAERAAPANRRDLFRFGAAQPDPAGRAEGETPAGRAAAPPPPVEQLPPQPAPIPLRWVGLAETAGGKVASLSDGRFVYNAREGDIVEGRWRIVRIGTESLVIERVDGTGRQTLRLAGG